MTEATRPQAETDSKEPYSEHTPAMRQYLILRDKHPGVMLRVSDSGRAAAKAGLTRCLPALNNPRLKARGCLAEQDVALKPAISRTFAWLQTPRQAFLVNFGTIFPKFHAFLGI